MKRLFTLAIIAMIASLTFAQAPVQKMKASDRKIEKVTSASQMSKAMEVKAAFDAKAKAAEETSSSVLRKAAHRPTMAMGQQVKAQKMVPNAQVKRVANATPNLKVKNGVAAPVKMVKKANSTTTATSKKAPKYAAGDVMDFNVFVAGMQYYGAPDYDWFFAFVDEDQTFQFNFDIANQPAEALPLNTEFTYDDMIADYTWAKNLYTGQYYEFSAVSFKATEGIGGKIDYHVTATLVDGTVCNLSCVATADPEITAYETFEFSADESDLIDYTAEMGVFQIMGDNGEQYVGVAFNSDQVNGTYNIDDAYMAYTNLYLTAADMTGVKPFALSATVTDEGATVIYDATNGTEYTLIFHFATEGGDPTTGDVTVTKDNNGIITSVEGGEPKTYQRSADGMVYVVSSTGVGISAQSGTVTVVEDGEKVYIKDPIARFTQNTWVEGTKNGNMITVPCGQPLTYNTNYATTISLRYGVVTAAGTIAAADDYADNIVYVVDGNTWTLQNTAGYGNTDGDAYFAGAIWDDDDSMAGGEAETVLTYDPTYVAPSTDLVVLPNGAEVQAWTMNATSVTSSSSSPVMNQPVNVAFVGNDVYVQGIFEDFPTAWVKGTKSGSTVTFANLQYIGNYGGSYDMYFAGTDGEGLTNATATLSADAQTLTFNEDLLANAATDRIYYLTWLENVVVSSVPAEEPVITDLTATLPYVNGFDTEAEVAEAAIYDANGDGKTWTIENDTKTGSDAARYTYNSSKGGNDYVVFPGLSLKAGTSYKVSVDARSNSSYYPEQIEVVAGAIAKASELTSVVVPATELATGDYETLTGEFTPEADGVYYFALHAVSEPDMFYLWADNFAVKENNPNAPNAVTEFTAVADETAALKATLTFTLPTTTVGGATIDDYVEYAISRDGVEIIQGAAAAGSTKTKVDNEPVNGNNKYSIVVKYNNLVSDPVSTTVYVGEDLPDEVENLVGFDMNGKVGLSWDAPSEGINGGIIIPENLTYNVYPVEMVEFFGMQFPAIDFENPYATAITETNAEVDFDTNSGAQGYTYFGVTAENVAGETQGAMASVLTGAPYELPFVETFPNGNLSYWWGVDYDDNIYDAEGGLGITTEGELVYNAPCEGWIELMSGKIALDGAENPALSFSYKTDAAATLQVKVITPEDEEIVGLMPVENTEWATANIDLGFYADQPWVRFNIVGNFEEATQLYVDNLIVMDMVQNDLQIAVSAPKTVTAGKAAVVKATVKNVGQATAEDYQVKFYVNDVEAPAPMFETPALAFMETAEFEFELETSIFDEAGDVVVKAEVVFGADEKDADNADECVVTVVAPSAAPVESVVAEQTADGVAVSWTVAENSAAETTEDFESYEVGIYTESMGDWTGKDGDQGFGYGWNSASILWDYTGEPYAFAIMNFPNVFGSATDIEATSGEQALMFMSVTDETGAGFPADDWFISPELPGVAQTISFQARPMTANYGPETLEVMASEDGNNWSKVATFNLIDEEFVECSANLAEGTKYFALHYTSNDIFALFVDDLKYTVGGANPTGFNVYVDENLVAALDAEARSYTYAEEISEGNHDFSVTAVYGSSESAPATVTLGVATGIQNINAASNVEVYTLDGIRINNVKNLKAGVYVVNGKKLVIK